MADHEKFDTAVPAWQEWQDAPWGRLRYAVAEADLGRHLDEDRPLRVLDLGGGDGGDAVRLAARGHRVTVVDHAPVMLATATRRAAAAGLTDRITCVEADVAALPDHLAYGAFDVVLCHSVLPYTPDTEGTLGVALGALREGGLVSVIAMNRHSEPLRAAVRTMDPEAVLTALRADTVHTEMFDAELRLHTAEELGDALRVLGCSEVHHYGIRVFCDYIPDDTLKYDPAYYAHLERLEIETAGRTPYKHTARLLHLIGRRGD
ncbi:methyltransferase domain-containing protein [Streptomyces showdoensis]|uniref:Methyltransferase n=1 Tax=Streptomyces showdoensis TaxID=68268 RepID=A0A2P2GUY1_STREW|nr:methyltransferase domain-containing protein [Streptomyces showdoensis]KKZ75293.1 methyltransferase [Streptomyces showdoensis]